MHKALKLGIGKYLNWEENWTGIQFGVSRSIWFLGKVIRTLTELTGVPLPMEPTIDLRNDDSPFSNGNKPCKVWLTGLTADKKIVVHRWKPHDISSSLLTGFWVFWTFLTWSYLQHKSTMYYQIQFQLGQIWNLN